MPTIRSWALSKWNIRLVDCGTNFALSRLKPVNRLGREWKLLNKYVETGVPENADFGVQVLDAFQVNRAVENEKFKYVINVVVNVRGLVANSNLQAFQGHQTAQVAVARLSLV
jgi:hypothetical protein